MKKNFTPKACEWCKQIFVPTSHAQRYCPECGALSKEERKRMRKVVTTGKRPYPTTQEVIAFSLEYEKRTGRYISYGRAVAMMERGGSGKR